MARARRWVGIAAVCFALLGILPSGLSSQAPLVPGEYGVEFGTDEACRQSVGEIVVPQGMVATDFTWAPPGMTWIPCAGPAPADSGWVCIYVPSGTAGTARFRGRAVYYFEQFHKGKIVEPVALKALTLAPGTYRAFSGGQRRIVFDIRYHLKALRGQPPATRFVRNVTAGAVTGVNSAVLREAEKLPPPGSNPANAVGAVLWTLNEENGQVFSPEVALAADGTIHVASPTKLYAIAAGGARRWTAPLPPCGGYPVVGTDGTVHVTCGNQILAFDRNGKRKWAFTDPQKQSLNNPAVANDGVVYAGHVASGAYVRKILAVGKNGKLLWSVDSKITAVAPLTLGRNGDIYYVASPTPGQIGLMALERSKGKQRWFLPLGGGDPAVFGGMAVGSDGTVYVPLTNQARLVAVNSKGKKLWEYKGNRNVGPAAIGPDGTIYAAFNGIGVAALSPSGTLRWKGGAVTWVSGLALTAKSQVLFSYGSNVGGLLGALAGNGTVAWQSSAPAGSGSPAVDGTGTVYVVAERVLTAVRGDGTLAKAPWPRGRGDNRNAASGK